MEGPTVLLVVALVVMIDFLVDLLDLFKEIAK
jgi:hypothetical protein